MANLRMSLVLGPTLLLLAIPAAAAAQDAAGGSKVFARCQACHSVDPRKSGGIGPSLAGVVGRKAGTQSGYMYSKAMAAAGFVWDRAKLDAYLEHPQAVVPGNKMPFGGIPNAKDRQDVVAFLATKKK